MKKDYKILNRFPKSTIYADLSLEKIDDGIELALSNEDIGDVFTINFVVAKNIYDDLGEMLKDNSLVNEMQDLTMEIISKILRYQKREDIERLVHIAQDLREYD